MSVATHHLLKVLDEGILLLVLALGSLSLHVLTQNLISDLGSTDMISLLRLGKMALIAALLVELADATFFGAKKEDALAGDDGQPCRVRCCLYSPPSCRS